MKYLWWTWLWLYCTIALGQNSLSEKQLTDYFFPHGKAIGQPFTSKQPYIRMVRVNSYDEAYDFFKAICRLPEELKVRQNKGYTYYYFCLPDKGCLIFTDKVVSGRNEVAILWIKVPFLIKQGIREVHFVQTIKIKPKDWFLLPFFNCQIKDVCYDI